MLDDTDELGERPPFWRLADVRDQGRLRSLGPQHLRRRLPFAAVLTGPDHIVQTPSLLFEARCGGSDDLQERALAVAPIELHLHQGRRLARPQPVLHHVVPDAHPVEAVRIRSLVLADSPMPELLRGKRHGSIIDDELHRECAQLDAEQPVGDIGAGDPEHPQHRVGDQQQPERIDQDVTLASVDLLARIVAVDPPFSVVLTDWLSRIAAEGWR